MYTLWKTLKTHFSPKLGKQQYTEVDFHCDVALVEQDWPLFSTCHNSFKDSSKRSCVPLWGATCSVLEGKRTVNKAIMNSIPNTIMCKIGKILPPLDWFTSHGRSHNNKRFLGNDCRPIKQWQGIKEEESVDSTSILERGIPKISQESNVHIWNSSYYSTLIAVRELGARETMRRRNSCLWKSRYI